MKQLDTGPLRETLRSSLDNGPSDCSQARDLESQQRREMAIVCTTRLLGSYRSCEASDPEIYIGAVEEVLSHYPCRVIESVTHPHTGLPSRSNFPPSVFEIRQACDAIMHEEARAARRAEDLRQQFAEREAEDERRAAITLTPPLLLADTAERKPDDAPRRQAALSATWADCRAGIIDFEEAGRRDLAIRGSPNVIIFADAHFAGAGGLAASAAVIEDELTPF